MPIINLSFFNPLNVSVQIGDIAYFCHTQDIGAPNQWASTVTPHQTARQNEIIKIGNIISLSQWNGSESSIQCNMDSILFNAYFNSLAESEQEPFIMFSKDNKVNMVSILGYYASIEYRNNSLEKAELFNVGAEMFESSK
tara:strand:- start:111 stop:530 length:420 start_codon:yes stop_codon:yes gene_type:complete